MYFILVLCRNFNLLLGPLETQFKDFLSFLTHFCRPQIRPKQTSYQTKRASPIAEPSSRRTRPTYLFSSPAWPLHGFLANDPLPCTLALLYNVPRLEPSLWTLHLEPAPCKCQATSQGIINMEGGPQDHLHCTLHTCLFTQS